MRYSYIISFVLSILICFQVLIGQNEAITCLNKNVVVFTQNKGQISDQYHKPRPDVLFSGKANGMVYHLKNNGVSYQLSKIESWKEIGYMNLPEGALMGKEGLRFVDKINLYRLDINWIGSNKDFKIVTDGALKDYTNYYSEVCPDGIIGVKSYVGVTYKNIYNNIDLHYYQKNGQLKYDFIVAPNANYKQIQLQVEGATTIKLLNDGSVVFKTPLGDIKEEAPLVYQNNKLLKAKWVLEGNILSFFVENYNPKLPLIIDPVARLWGTYFGDTSEDQGWSITTDNAGNVYGAGYTESGTGNVIATVGSHQVTYNGGGDVFLVKFNAAGARQWATYYGGSGYELFNPCNADGNGNIYIAGHTTSSAAIATPGCHQLTFGGGGYDAFIAKFNTNGIRQWGTYYGGTSNDFGLSYSTDNIGNVYLTGATSSNNNISTSGAHQTVFGGVLDGYIVQFNSIGVRQWATYYGGTGDDQPIFSCTDVSGNLYVSGMTNTSTGTIIATLGSHQPAFGGGSYDGFLIKFNNSGARQWGTYYGDVGNDRGYSTQIDNSGNIYLSGLTTSTVNIATSGSHQQIYGGGIYDGYFVQFNNSGVRQWASYYGGGGDDRVAGMSLDAIGNLYIAGFTSTNSGTIIATPGSHQPTYGGGVYDAYLIKMNNSGVRQWGTYYGGLGEDQGHNLSVSPTNNIFVVGSTLTNSGTLIATANSHQPNYGGGGVNDAFIASFIDCNDMNVSIIASPTIACESNTIALYGVGAASYTWSNNSNSNVIILTPTSNISYTVTGSLANCTNTGQSTISLTLNPSPTITANSGTICAGETFTINPSGAVSYSYSGGNPNVTPTTTTIYTVTGASSNGCLDTTISVVNVNPAPVITASGGSVCAGSSFTIIPNGAVTYTFSSSSAIVTPTVTTSYTITGTGSNGCSSYIGTMVTVSVMVLPTITVNSGSICAGKTFTMIPGGASTYTFSSVTSTVSPVITSSYSVIGTSTAGCYSSNTAISNVTVNPLPVISVNSGTICKGQSFTMSPSGASTYTFSSVTPIVSPTINNTYSVTGTSSLGCIGTSIAISTIIVNPLPTITVNSGSICSGQSFTIIPIGANTYTITGGNTVVTPTANTSYSVIGTNSLGCNSASSAVSNVVVMPVPNITINSGSICFGQTFTFNPIGAVSYTYSSVSSTVSPIVNSSYTITGSSAFGCKGTAVSNVTVNQLPVINIISNNSLICSGQSATLTASGANTFTWNSNSTGNTEVVSPTITTSYTVNGTDVNGCNNSSTFIQNVNPCTSLINFIENSVSEVLVYPNPTTGKIYFSNVSSSPYIKVVLIDSQGKGLKAIEIKVDKEEIDISELSNGLYFVQIWQNGNLISTRKVSKI
jgi:hypothetical protein